ncbi:MAG TPA: M90 family metallopeptidase [Vicinamibacteria bacterium]
MGAALPTGGFVAGFLISSGLGGLAGLALGGLLAWVLQGRRRRRTARRQAALALPFPEAWRTFLRDRYDHFERLPEALRRRFEDDLRLFLLDKRITGVGVEVTDELRILTAASAVTLSLGWPDYEWDQLTEVLLYPQEFDRDYGFEGGRSAELDEEGRPPEPELAGLAHPWGTVILSVPSLLEGFEDPDDGFHVGLHEFAHLLEVDRSQIGGIPMGLTGERARAWVGAATREMERLVREGQERETRRKRGRRRELASAFDPYGDQDPVEFLAVAIEAFFEASLAVRQQHREIYDLLADYFGQDPAGWDDARGLVLD